jgi:hypothetical protein
MTMSNTVCIRLTEEEKRELLKYGNLSSVLREAMKLYLSTKKSAEILHKLGELQAKNPINTTVEQEVQLIREDRSR